MDSDQVLTLKEVAALLRMSERTAYRLAAAGKLPGFKPGGGPWRFRRRDIDAWIDRQIEEGSEAGPDEERK